MSGGLIFGIATTCCLIRMSYYFWLSDSGVEFGAAIMFISASLLCIPTSWITSMLPQYPRNIPMAGSLLCLISVTIFLMVNGLSTSSGLSQVVRDPKILNTSLHRAMSLEKYDYYVRNAFDTMQLDLKCCGIESFKDWYEHRYNMPSTCCGRLVSNGHSKCDNPLYKQGCLHPAVNQLRAYLGSVGLLAYAMIFALTITLLVTTYTVVHASVKNPPIDNPLSTIRITYPPSPPAPLSGCPPYQI